MLCITFVASAADATGKWTGEIPGRGGNQPITFNLKAAGATLTGTITTAQGDTPIADGKVDWRHDHLSQYDPGPRRHPQQTTYTGKVGADAIEFTREGGRGPVTFTAKKASKSRTPVIKGNFPRPVVI